MMPKRFAQWLWQRRKRVIVAVLLLLLVAVNAVAFMHARAMTHFSRDGARTLNPEELSTWEKLKVVAFGVNIPRPENEYTPADMGLRFEVHHLKTADDVGLEGWHIPIRNPRGVVLMFHGYSACKSYLLSEALAFCSLGYDVFLVDFRGSGGSDGHQTTIGVFEAEDVAAALRFARRQWGDRPIVCFGQSMGSAAILRCISDSKIQPDALVLECPFDRLLGTVENRFASMRLPSFPLAHLLVFWGGVQNSFNGFTHNPVDYAKDVHCPVLLLQGADDTRVTRAQAEEIYSQFGGPKHLHVFESVGHRSYVGTKQDEWKKQVREFLQTHLPPRNS
jgi:alpha-beta hydrolase superfamily lysophospholipase